jgi:hypothetical protein
MPRRSKVAVIFDLDETIGHFYQIGKIWEGLKFFEEDKFKNKEFFKLLDMFPFVFRPQIFDVFRYLRDQKKKDSSIRVIIYSNNTGTPKWANLIKKYIEKKIDYKLFDKVITAWKVNGVILEPCRSTNEKTYEEILKCGNLNENMELFFVDDAYHPKMFHDNVDYMHIKEYRFAYEIGDMIEKYLNSDNCKKLSKKSLIEIRGKLPEYVKRLNWGRVRYKNKEKPSTDELILGKELRDNIKSFLNEKNKHTRRRRGKKQKRGKTRKK